MAPDSLPMDMIRRYLTRRQSDLNHLIESIENRDFSKAAAIGHQIKGNGSTFGFPELAEIARQIEGAAKSQNGDGLIKFVSDFKVCLGNIESRFADLNS